MVVSGFAELPGANSVMIADLARELKGKLGCGGSFDRQEIVLQGDRCAAVNALLEELGFRVDGVKGRDCNSKSHRTCLRGVNPSLGS